MTEEYEVRRIAEDRYRIKRVSHLPALLFLVALLAIAASFFSNLTRPRSWDDKALYLITQGKYQDALQIANQKLLSHSLSQDEISSAYFIQHDAYTGMGKTEAAIQSFQKGLKLFKEKHCLPEKKTKSTEVDLICTATARELHKKIDSLNRKK